jgi:hypothetical protein
MIDELFYFGIAELRINRLDGAVLLKMHIQITSLIWISESPGSSRQGVCCVVEVRVKYG